MGRRSSYLLLGVITCAELDNICENNQTMQAGREGLLLTSEPGASFIDNVDSVDKKRNERRVEEEEEDNEEKTAGSQKNSCASQSLS